MRALLAVILIWAGWVGYQYVNKIDTAHMLIERTADQLNTVDFNVLLDKVGRGYESNMHEIDGKRYWVRYLVRRPISGGLPQYYVEELLVEGRVDFLELVPFTDIRTGLPFKITLKKSELQRTY